MVSAVMAVITVAVSFYESRMIKRGIPVGSWFEEGKIELVVSKRLDRDTCKKQLYVGERRLIKLSHSMVLGHVYYSMQIGKKEKLCAYDVWRKELIMPNGKKRLKLKSK